MAFVPPCDCCGPNDDDLPFSSTFQFHWGSPPVLRAGRTTTTCRSALLSSSIGAAPRCYVRAERRRLAVQLNFTVPLGQYPCVATVLRTVRQRVSPLLPLRSTPSVTTPDVTSVASDSIHSRALRQRVSPLLPLRSTSSVTTPDVTSRGPRQGPPSPPVIYCGLQRVSPLLPLRTVTTPKVTLHTPQRQISIRRLPRAASRTPCSTRAAKARDDEHRGNGR